MSFNIADYLTLANVVPAIVTAVTGAVVGGVTFKKVLTAACQIVYALADKEFATHEKRAIAIAQLYTMFPKLGPFVPQALMGTLVDLAWDDVIAPVATGALVVPDVAPPAVPPTP